MNNFFPGQRISENFDLNYFNYAIFSLVFFRICNCTSRGDRSADYLQDRATLRMTLTEAKPRARDLATRAPRWHEFTDFRVGAGGWALEGAAYATCTGTNRERMREREKRKGGEKRPNHTFELVDLERARSYLHLDFVLRNCLHACDFIPRGIHTADARARTRLLARRPYRDRDRIARKLIMQKTQSGARGISRLRDVIHHRAAIRTTRSVSALCKFHQRFIRMIDAAPLIRIYTANIAIRIVREAAEHLELTPSTKEPQSSPVTDSGLEFVARVLAGLKLPSLGIKRIRKLGLCQNLMSNKTA